MTSSAPEPRRSHLRCRLLLPAWVAIVLVSSACGLSTDFLKLKRDRLTAELAELQALAVDLNDPNFPPGQRDLEFFLSYSLLNRVLEGADGFSAPIPGVKGATFQLVRARLRSVDGPPYLDVEARAVRGGLAVDLEVNAELLADPPAKPEVFRVRVNEIKPVFSWNCVRLGGIWFARQLATVKADQWALDALHFPIPVEQAFAVDVPGTDVVVAAPTKGGVIRARIQRPALPTYYGLVTLDKILFLRDGIHLLATVEKEAQ